MNTDIQKFDAENEANEIFDLMKQLPSDPNMSQIFKVFNKVKDRLELIHTTSYEEGHSAALKDLNL